MVSREAGPHEMQPKMLKGELEATLDSQGTLSKGLSESLKMGQLTLYHCKLKKGDDVLMMKILMW
jgi:hypothetical protein